MRYRRVFVNVMKLNLCEREKIFPYLLVPFYPKDKNYINTLNEEQINIYLTSFGKQIDVGIFF